MPLAPAPTLEVTLTPEISLHGWNLPNAWGTKARLREVPRASCDLGQRGCGHPSLFLSFVISSVTGRKPLLHPATFPSAMVLRRVPLRVPGELLEFQKLGAPQTTQSSRRSQWASSLKNWLSREAAREALSNTVGWLRLEGEEETGPGTEASLMAQW